ncbi:MAG: hypothetical protein ACREMG_04190 [Gemmatimonadales bacterium]
MTDAVDERVDRDARAREVLGQLAPFEALVTLMMLDGRTARQVARLTSTPVREVRAIGLRVVGLLRGE